MTARIRADILHVKPKAVSVRMDSDDVTLLSYLPNGYTTTSAQEETRLHTVNSVSMLVLRGRASLAKHSEELGC